MALNLSIPRRRAPFARWPSPQLAFPMPRQHRPVRKESRRLYAAILRLRRAGRTVYRRGAEHLCDGRQLSARQLIRLSRDIGNAS